MSGLRSLIAMASVEVVAVTAIGLLFFSGHLFFTLVAARSAKTRDQRLEAMGLLMRGLPGLLMVIAVAARSRPIVSLICLIAAIPTLVLGRAVYELVVFRGGLDR